MPADDYAAAGGGALRLKGAKVHKTKKKKKPMTTTNKGKSDLEKNLTAGDTPLSLAKTGGAQAQQQHQDEHADEHADDSPVDAADTDQPAVPKTDAERRYDETRKKRLLQMTRASGQRPELLKTHKERVEELNTYLSKLSEHHDMPKIGPG